MSLENAVDRLTAKELWALLVLVNGLKKASPDGGGPSSQEPE